MAGQSNSSSSGVRLQSLTPIQQTGAVSISGPIYIDNSSVLSHVMLGETFATNDPFHMVSGYAFHIKSDDVAMPVVDGIILESGNLSDLRPCLTVKGTGAFTVIPVPVGVQLWLSQTGTLTDVIPSIAAGDTWIVPVCRSETGDWITLNDPMAIKL